MLWSCRGPGGDTAAPHAARVRHPPRTSPASGDRTSTLVHRHRGPHRGQGSAEHAGGEQRRFPAGRRGLRHPSQQAGSDLVRTSGSGARCWRRDATPAPRQSAPTAGGPPARGSPGAAATPAPYEGTAPVAYALCQSRCLSPAVSPGGAAGDLVGAGAVHHGSLPGLAASGIPPPICGRQGNDCGPRPHGAGRDGDRTGILGLGPGVRHPCRVTDRLKVRAAVSIWDSGTRPARPRCRPTGTGRPWHTACWSSLANT